MKSLFYVLAAAALPSTLFASPTPEGASGFAPVFTPDGVSARAIPVAEGEAGPLEKRASCYVSVPSSPGFVRCYQSASVSSTIVGYFQSSGYYNMQCWKYAVGYPGSESNCVSGNWCVSTASLSEISRIKRLTAVHHIASGIIMLLDHAGCHRTT